MGRSLFLDQHITIANPRDRIIPPARVINPRRTDGRAAVGLIKASPPRTPRHLEVLARCMSADHNRRHHTPAGPL
jgi:hypothetical protein